MAKLLLLQRLWKTIGSGLKSSETPAIAFASGGVSCAKMSQLNLAPVPDGQDNIRSPFSPLHVKENVRQKYNRRKAIEG